MRHELCIVLLRSCLWKSIAAAAASQYKWRIDADGEIYPGLYYLSAIYKRKRTQHCDTYSDIPLCVTDIWFFKIAIVKVAKKQNAWLDVFYCPINTIHYIAQPKVIIKGWNSTAQISLQCQKVLNREINKPKTGRLLDRCVNKDFMGSEYDV